MNNLTTVSRVEALCEEGDKAAKNGRFPEAMEQFQKALSLEPDYLPAHYNLGRVLLVIGQQQRQDIALQTALEHLEKVLKLDPDFTKALISKGTALALMGRMDEAVHNFQHALARDPNNVEAHQWLGELYKKQNKLDEAIYHHRALLALTPTDLEARRRLGGVLILKSKHSGDITLLEEAKIIFHDIITAHPDDAEAYISLGTTYLLGRGFNECFEAFNRAIAINPKSSEAYFRLGVAYHNSGRNYEDALQALKKSIELNPDNSSAYVSLALTLEQLNNIDELGEVAKTMVTRWPNSLQAAILLGRLALRRGELNEAKRYTEVALSTIGESFGAETLLADLAKVYEQEGDYDKAFAHYFKAQQASMGNIFYKYFNPQQFSNVIVTMRHWFNRFVPEKSTAYIPEKDERAPPVFFVGFPRSGTTLVEQMLHSHKDIITGQEEVWIGDIAIRLKELLGKHVPYPGSIYRLDQKQIRILRDEYWRLVEQTIPPETLKGKTLVDKLPLNMPHLPFIHHIFPDAKIIVAIRDPRDVILSCFIQIFSPNNGMANFSSLETAAVLYMNIMNLYLRYREQLDIPLLQYRYEDLVQDVEGYAKKFIDHIGLPWDENVLHYYEEKNRRTINTPSYEGVSKPIYKSSVARWKRFGKYMAPMLPLLNPLVEKLGYTPEELPMEEGMEAYWVQSYCRMADSLAKQEFFDEAITYFEKAIALDSDCVEAHTNLGRIYLLLGQSQNDASKIEKAVIAFEKALKLDPNNPSSTLYLGKAYELVGNAGDSKRVLQRAVMLNPENPDAYFYLAQSCSMNGELPQTLEAINAALKYSPDWIEALTYKANILERMNLFDEVKATIAQAQKVNPDYPKLLLPLARLERREGNYAKAREYLERLLQLVGEDAIVLHDLGRTLNLLEDYDGAYAAYARSQQILSLSCRNNTSAPNELYSNTEIYRKWFTKERIEKWKKTKIADTHHAPVFLVGFPRSGTTLMEQILWSHPNIETTNEQGLLDDMIRAAPMLLQKPQYEPPEILDHINGKEIGRLRDFYRERYQTAFPNHVEGRTVVDKLPLNIRKLGFVQRIFPDAKVITMIRDPRDVVMSCFFQLFQPNAAMVNFYDLESAVRLYDNVMGLYLHQKNILSLDILEIRYRDLIDDIEGNARKILDFIGEEWNPAVLEYYAKDKNRFVATPSYTGVMRPIYTTSVDRWKNYEKYLAPYMKILEPYIEAFGYEK